MRKASDELCRAHSLSVIKNPTGHTPRSIYFAEKRGEPTKYNLMRHAIDFAITCSKYPGDFEKVMLKQGYVVDANPKRKHATIRSVNDTKETRMHRLGEEYLPENIIARIRSNTIKACGNYNYFMNRKPNRPRKRRVHGSFSKAGKVTGLVALYYHYRYLLGLTPKKYRPLSPEIREDLRRLNRYSEQVRLIGRKHFKDDVDVITDLKSERDRLTDRLAKLRKEVRTANNIVADITKMKENIRIERQMRKPPQRKRVRELER